MFLILGTYDLTSRRVKFSQETFIATAEYDAQFEYTPDTEEEDGSCKSYHVNGVEVKMQLWRKESFSEEFRLSFSFVMKVCQAHSRGLGKGTKITIVLISLIKAMV